jgi:choline dehydrogenase
MDVIDDLHSGDKKPRHSIFLEGIKVDKVARHGIFYPRAGRLGGCTAHHAMVFIAPHNGDWGHIAKITGDRSWAPRRMRRYFERMERCEYAKRPWSRWLNSARHGFDGWLTTTISDPSLLLRDLVLARLVIAATQTSLGAYVRNLERFLQQLLSWASSFFDPNDWLFVKRGSEGVVLPPMTTRNGKRAGTRELIRETMRARPDKLTVMLHAFVTRILLDGDKRATGVEFVRQPHLYRADPRAFEGFIPEQRRTVRAKREVILAGGSFNTPQLLMLSGIGPPCELRRHDIEVAVPLPGVGQNLQDRYEVGVVHKMRTEFEVLRNATFKPDDPAFEDDPEYREWRNGHGLYTTNGAVIAIIKRSSHCQPDPDLYLFAIPGYFAGYHPQYCEHSRAKNYFTWVILKAHTKNTAGRVLLKSSDPCEPPDINFRYFDEGNDTYGDDLDAVVAGIEFVRKITRRTAGLFDEEIPGTRCHSREALERFVKDCAWGHHACGTCKIGADNDPYAVLDSRFRVRGTKGLRVVDASAFPKISGFFILSAVYMIAEKASDVIIADARPGRRRMLLRQFSWAYKR